MSHLIDYDIYSLNAKKIVSNSIRRNDTCLSYDRHIFNAFHKKIYVKFDDKCSICVDCIGPAHNAFITDCGHTFHKTCLSNYFHYLQFNKHKLSLRCPVCRSNLGSPEFFGLRYYSDLSIDYNGLDLLENYSNPNNLNDLIHICHHSNITKSHYLGTDCNCENCKLYISGK